MGRMCMRKCVSFGRLALGLLLLSCVNLPSVAQEFVKEHAARKLLRLPTNERGDFVAITDIAFSPDGESMAIGASDGAVRMLRIAEGERPQIVIQGENPVRKVAFSPDGNLLASAALLQANLTVVGQVGEERKIDQPPLLKSSECIAFSPDGRLLAVGSSSGDATLIDLTRGERRFSIAPFAGTGPVDRGLYDPQTVSMDFSPDGNLIAVTTDFFDDELPSFQNVQVWDTKTGKLRFFFRGVSCEFSPSGGLLAYQSQIYDGDGRIVLLDIDTFLPAAVLTGQFQDAGFAPDSHSMAAISHQQLEIWTVPSRDDRTRKCDRKIVLQHATNVTSFAFAPDGRSLVTGDAKGTIRLWSLAK